MDIIRPSRSFGLFIATLAGLGMLAPYPGRPLARAADNASTPDVDSRNIVTGRPIPSEGYADQPYIAKTNDGAWLCILTTGKGTEGAAGEHVVSMRSRDLGRTWTDIVPLEPADGPAAAYAVLLKVPYGRIYAFYNHNTDRLTEVKREDGKMIGRVDSLGHYVFKYTDDGGRTWSAERYEVPIRPFKYDLTNVYGGKIRFFWDVGRPLILGGAAFMVIHKVGAFGEGFFAKSEGAFFKSRNILTERDPRKITFETLPDGDVGLRPPAFPGGGKVAEEQSLVSLSDGSLFCVYRTVAGWPGCAYSRDGGHHWTQPQYLTYTPGGRRVKHPRAANFAWRCSNGKFLYWFHNHGGRFIQGMGAQWSGKTSPYDDRNPAWLAAGREVDSPQGRLIEWSQPEILLYDDDPSIRMSYPDLVEQDGKFYVTETQKSVARVHEIPAALLDGLFGQWDNHAVATDGLVLALPAGRADMPAEAAMPELPAFVARDMQQTDYRSKYLRNGLSIDLWVKADALPDGQVLFDSRTGEGQGILVTADAAGALKIDIDDGHSDSSWASDRGALSAGTLHHVMITVDGGPKIITFVVDGVLCDGGDERQFGWGRYSPNLRSANGARKAHIAPSVRSLRIYDRALRTSEAVGNFQAGPPAPGA